MRTLLFSSTAFLLAAPAFALDNAELWEETVKQFTDLGAELTIGSVSDIGDVLTAENVAFVFRSSEMLDDTELEGEPGEFDIRGVIPSWTLTDQGDGVLMKMSDLIKMEVETRGSSEAFSAKFDIRQSGASTTVSGEIGALDYVTQADELVVEMTEASPASDEDGDVIETFVITMAKLAGTYDVDGSGDLRSTKADLSAGTLSMAMAGTDADEDGAPITIDLAATGFTFTSDGTWPAGMSMFDPKFIRSGVTGTAAYGHDSSSVKIAATDAGQEVVVDMTTGAILVDTTFSGEALGYTVSMADTDVQVQGPLPIPVGGAMDLFKFGLTMPIAVGGEPTDYAFDMALENLKLDDIIWSMFDPTSALPRDPASIKIAVEGTARWFVDFFDEEAMEKSIMAGESMGEFNSAKITELVVSAAGAELTGTGDFTFDNSDMETFEGFPRPEGQAALKLVGGNGLLDKIVAMGLVPEDEAMGIRMGAMMFTTAGDGEDELVTEVELGEGGSVTVNGQRLR